ncbi:DUF308 domain-containing protein [Nocardia sp. NPDC052001]|uniref:DUF308 domain-containing protein n=1 Tax=Nocardia sp. NPDC052001 TaxID=3154853 RepID=UPI003426DA7F
MMVDRRTSGESSPQPRPTLHHAGEGIEDGVNVIGIVLGGLAIVALGLTLVAAGYGFAGWATVAGIACVVLFLSSAGVIYAEWRRRSGDEQPDPEVRQGH